MRALIPLSAHIFLNEQAVPIMSRTAPARRRFRLKRCTVLLSKLDESKRAEALAMATTEERKTGHCVLNLDSFQLRECCVMLPELESNFGQKSDLIKCRPVNDAHREEEEFLSECLELEQNLEDPINNSLPRKHSPMSDIRYKLKEGIVLLSKIKTNLTKPKLKRCNVTPSIRYKMKECSVLLSSLNLHRGGTDFTLECSTPSRSKYRLRECYVLLPELKKEHVMKCLQNRSSESYFAKCSLKECSVLLSELKVAKGSKLALASFPAAKVKYGLKECTVLLPTLNLENVTKLVMPDCHPMPSIEYNLKECIVLLSRPEHFDKQ